MSEPGSAKDVIDLEDAARRIPGGLDGVKQMAPDLLQECTQQLDAIRSALVASDSEKVRLAAHTIKGSAGVFAAARVADAARTLEEIGREADLERAPGAIDELAAELDLLSQTLSGMTDS